MTDWDDGMIQCWFCDITRNQGSALLIPFGHKEQGRDLHRCKSGAACAKRARRNPPVDLRVANPKEQP